MPNQFVTPLLPRTEDPARRPAARDSATIYLQQLPALTLMDRLLTPVLAFDRWAVISYVNDAFVAMLGYRNCAQLRGIPVNEIAGPDSRRNLPADQVELLDHRAGATTTWEHARGHSVTTAVSPMMRLRVFNPLALMVLTEITSRAAG